MLIRVLSLSILASTPVLAALNEFIALCYHDVVDSTRDTHTTDTETVTSAELVAHFSWLRENNYNPISIDDILAARDGLRPLPAKAILLTFDDGYVSHYTRVYPLLKAFQFPAVFAISSSWMEGNANNMVTYGNKKVRRSTFLTWRQIKEMMPSGLVEIASHSHALHQGILGNPQGNRQPAATTRRYDRNTGQYESESHYEQRIRDDLTLNLKRIKKNTGATPRIMVWPYGRYSQQIIQIAQTLNMPITMTLEDGINTIDQLQTVRRVVLKNNVKLQDLVSRLEMKQDNDPIRLSHVYLDTVYDANPEQQEINLGLLLDRIKALHINTVYLQAFADSNSDGNADAMYFPNRHMPVRADLFNRVAWQLHTRANVHVYAWMPVLAFDLPKAHPLKMDLVKTIEHQQKTKMGYQRLSPFNPAARQIILEIYEDLARSAAFSGLLFHDDVTLSDFEDASPLALRYYQQQWRLPASIEAIRNDEALLDKWTTLKTHYLIDWTQELAERITFFRPTIKTARNIDAKVIMNPDAERQFAQSFDAFLENYDYTTVMATPDSENPQNLEKWLQALSKKIAKTPNAATKTVIELQAKTTRQDKAIDANTLAQRMALLTQAGLPNFGYYPDDFLTGHPALEDIHPFISLSTYPYKE